MRLRLIEPLHGVDYNPDETENISMSCYTAEGKIVTQNCDAESRQLTPGNTRSHAPRVSEHFTLFVLGIQ